MLKLWYFLVSTPSITISPDYFSEVIVLLLEKQKEFPFFGVRSEIRYAQVLPSCFYLPICYTIYHFILLPLSPDQVTAVDLAAISQ